MAVSETTKKELIGMSYNQCNYQGCDKPIVEFDDNAKQAVIVGEAAHICGKRPGSERYDKTQTDAERDHFDNLLMMCAKHHKMIDKSGAGKTYTAETLRRWKAEHQKAKIGEADKSWIHTGGETLMQVGSEWTRFSWWIDKNGRQQIYTPEQLVVARSLRSMSQSIAKVQSLLSILDQTDGEPADPSNQSFNDSYMRMLKKRAEDLKNGKPSWIWDMHEMEMMCKDLTIGDLMVSGVEGGLSKRDELYQDANERLIEKARETEVIKTIKP